jgi:hypothetical protein
MKRLWENLAHYGALAVLLAVVGSGLAAMEMLPGVHLAEGSRTARPCDELPGKAVPSLGASHLPYLGASHVAYNSSPPTSGPHMPWLIGSGVYGTTIPPEYQVHLLEHGKVLIQYPAGAPSSTRKAIERIARRRSDVVVSAPSRDVRRGVALTAWQRIQLLPRFDGSRVGHFVDALAGRYSHGWSAGADDCVRGRA